MIDWRGDCTDGSVVGDPEQDPNQYGAPQDEGNPPQATYDPTDPNDPMNSNYGQVPGETLPPDFFTNPDYQNKSLLDKILQGLAGDGKGMSKFGNEGSVLSSAAKGSQAQNNTEDKLRAEIAAEMERAKLNRQKFAVTAPGERLSSSARASMMSNFTPTKVNWGGPGSGLRGEVPTYSGGASGALANLDPKTKAQAQQTMMDQLLGETQGGLSGGGQDSQMPNAPTVGQTSGLDKLLGGGGLISSLIAALMQGQQQPPQQPQPQPAATS